MCCVPLKFFLIFFSFFWREDKGPKMKIFLNTQQQQQTATNSNIFIDITHKMYKKKRPREMFFFFNKYLKN